MRRGQSRVIWCVAGALLIAALVAAPSGADQGQPITVQVAAKGGVPPATIGEFQPLPEWGTLTTAVKSILAQSFVPLLSNTTWGIEFVTAGYQRYGTGGQRVFDETLDLPSGALVLGITFDGCDTSATESVVAAVFISPENNAVPYSAPIVLDTGAAGTPGCTAAYVAAATPFTVDNALNSYGLEVFTSATDNSTSFKSMRVHYVLQVSPAPATATFGDVGPTDFAFQHIEALAASGITVGCGGGNFCPNDPLTRAQMAVFLSKALGLHWAP